MKATSNKKQLRLRKLNFAIPLMAITGLGTIGVFAINQDIDPGASASNISTLKSTLSYDDQYITISNSSVIDLGTTSITADSSYAYTTDNVTVSTNVDAGYEFYISSGSQDSAALTTPSSYTEIATTSGSGGDGGTPAVLDRNTYGYAVPSSLINNTKFDADYTSPTSSSVWAAVPVGSSDRIHSTNAANEAGDTVDVHYGANLTNALAPGEYTGKIIYSAVVTPSNAYEMSVSPASGVIGTTLTIASGPTTVATDAKLDPNEVEIQFRQSGATKGNCTVVNVDTSSGHLVTTCTAPNLTAGLYDVVVMVSRYGYKDTKFSAYTSTYTNVTQLNTTMQKMTSSSCSVLTTYDSSNIAGTTYAVTDSRDGNVYFIRKLADGNCWMAQNLRLVGPRTLTSADSDVPSGYSFALPSSATWTDTSLTGNHLISATTAPVGSTTGSATASDIAYARGTYYSWCTATADCGPTGVDTVKSTSICPKGWDLSNDTGDRSYGVLYETYLKTYGNFLNAYDYYYSNNYDSNYYLSGLWDTDGFIDKGGTESYWWSSGTFITFNSDTLSGNNKKYAWVMIANNSKITVTDNSRIRYNGRSVRCVLAGS